MKGNVLPYRRTYHRFLVNDSASLITQEGKEVRVLLKDLSAGGIGVFGNHPLDINKTMEVTVNIPFFFPKPIHRQARVSWCNRVDTNSWEAGLNFVLNTRER